VRELNNGEAARQSFCPKQERGGKKEWGFNRRGPIGEKARGRKTNRRINQKRYLVDPAQRQKRLGRGTRYKKGGYAVVRFGPYGLTFRKTL